jgi:hypothetical protein
MIDLFYVTFVLAKMALGKDSARVRQLFTVSIITSLPQSSISLIVATPTVQKLGN